jgi:hypothetical protein
LKEKKVVASGYSRNAFCPVCGSLDRERLIYFYLLNKTNVFEIRQKLLHVAPEPGLADKFRDKADADYVTANLYMSNVLVW